MRVCEGLFGLDVRGSLIDLVEGSPARASYRSTSHRVLKLPHCCAKVLWKVRGIEFVRNILSAHFCFVIISDGTEGDKVLTIVRFVMKNSAEEQIYLRNQNQNKSLVGLPLPQSICNVEEI